MGSRERVVEYLSTSGIRFELREFEESTRSSALAARALGCSVAEIAKSVVFVGKGTALVILSGDRKVDPAKISRETGEEMDIGTPEEVKARTGFPIGGVPPFPHGPEITVFPERSLTRFREVWAAAGTPNAVFRISTEDLIMHAGRGPFDLAHDREGF